MVKEPPILANRIAITLLKKKNLSLPNTQMLCHEKWDAYWCAATDLLRDAQGDTEHFSD